VLSTVFLDGFSLYGPKRKGLTYAEAPRPTSLRGGPHSDTLAPKIIQARFGVAFFAGELQREKRMLARAVVHISQGIVGVEGVVGTGRSL